MKKAPDKVESTGEPPAPEIVKERLAKWFPELSEQTVDTLVTYHTNLLKFNKAINLISSGTVRNAESVHVADAVKASALIEPALVQGKPVYDLGSGNGCPGVIFGALHKQHRVILVDRDKRKQEFCKFVISEMKLANVSISTMGVEDIPDGSVTNGIARGFAPFGKALLTSRRQFAKGGRFMHMKSDGWANELAQMPSQVFTHWAPSLLGKYRLPDSSADFFVVMTEKLTD